MRGLVWWPIAVAAAAVGLFVGQWANQIGAAAAVLAVVALFFVLAAVPWIALRPGWVWWAATAAGALGGLIVGAAVDLQMMGSCGLGVGCPLANAVGFAIGLAILGIAQAFTLQGTTRKLAWLVVSVLGAVALSFSIAWIPAPQGPARGIAGTAVKLVLVGGLSWGTVVGLGLALLTSRPRPPIERG